MSKFTVSVIVPNYNNEKYLRQCLDSILSQTYTIKELIIYDDCSTDASKEILKEYAEKYKIVQVIYGGQNVGVSTARDIAIQSTTSDYVCMLDADDFFYSKKKLAAEMEKIESEFYNTGKTVVSFSQTVDVDEYGKPFGVVERKNLTGDERFKIVTRLYNNFMPRDYCFPREAYNAVGGYTKGLSLFEDWELNIKLLEKVNFVYSGEYGTAYRHKEGGLSSVNYKKQLKTKIDIFKKYKMSMKEKIVFYALVYGSYVKHLIRG